MHPVLSIRGLTKVRRQHDRSFALHADSLDFVRGEFVALVGDSGCGKSTLLDLLALVSRPDTVGTFDLNTRDGRTRALAPLIHARKTKPLSQVRSDHYGYVLQTGGLLPFLSVEGNALLPQKLSGKLDKDLIQTLAARLEISSVLTSLPRSLSGGQRQRAAILRALSHYPDVIFADEPTAAVDRRNARQIMTLFKSLAAEEGACVVVVSHDQSLLREFADRAFTFKLGDEPVDVVSTVVEGWDV